jgi:hypothetical protein
VKIIHAAVMRVVTVHVSIPMETRDGVVWVVVEKNYPGMRVLPSALLASVVCADVKKMVTQTTTGMNSKVG